MHRSVVGRREIFGEQALKLVRGELGLRFEKKRVAVIELPKTEA